MPKDPIQHAIDLVYRDWLGGYRPDNLHLVPQIKFYLLTGSQKCRKRHETLCERSPDCTCVRKAMRRVGIPLPSRWPAPGESDHPSLERGRNWKGVPETGPRPVPKPPGNPPPRKQPAMMMPKPKAPERIDAVARAANHNLGKAG